MLVVALHSTHFTHSNAPLSPPIPPVPPIPFEPSRKLFYTAITRAQRWAFVVGSRRALEAAIRRENANDRNTHLAQRMLTCTS